MIRIDLLDEKCANEKISIMESFKKVAVGHLNKNKGKIDTF
jgi:hypothetical protein